MKFVSKFTMAAVLGLSAPALLMSAPAAAQKKAEEPQLSLSKEERDTLAALQTAFNANDFAGAKTALAAAQAAAKGPDAKHFVAQYQYQIGTKTNDYALQADGIEALAASSKTAQADLPKLYGQLGVISYNYLRDFPRAERAFTREIELNPNATESIGNLARVKRELKKPQETMALLEKGIAAQTAAGQKAPESWYKLALDAAYTNKMPNAVKISRDLVSAYPTQQNWRDAMIIYRELGRPDADTQIDAYRLMRASKSLNGERDYILYADAVDKKGLPGEAKAVLDEGIGNKMLDGSKADVKTFLGTAARRAAEDRPTLNAQATKALSGASGGPALNMGDALLGYGDYAKAAELYQAAIQKGGVDANVANTRLGIALAMAGQKAPAEAAFKAVTGPRSELANFWLVWLQQRA